MRKYVLLLLCYGMWLLLPMLTWAADGKTLIFAYSPDDSPVSSYDKEIVGFCGAVYQYVEQYVDAQGKHYHLQVEPLGLYDRFGVFATSLKGKPGIQCGAHSITRQRREHLKAADKTFVGDYTHPIAITATKLLIRKDRVDALYTAPASVRIGMVKPPKPMTPVTKPGSAVVEPTTSVLIEGVFPNAVIVPLLDRGDAVTRLKKAVSDPEAIDAYVSTDILLQDMLHINLASVQEDYRIEPPSLDGFARQYVGLVVYNDPALLTYLNQWIDSAASADARAKLRPPADTTLEVVTWLNRSTDHLARVRVWGSLLLVVVGLLLVVVVWLLLRQRRLVRSQPISASLVCCEPEDNAPLETEEQPPLEVVGDDVPPLPLSCNAVISRRETEVLQLLAQGKQSGEIARLLGIETKTVETHRQNLRAKLGLRNTAELTRYAIENNI